MLTQTASTTAESTTKTIWKKSSLLMLILASLGAVFLFVQSSGLKVFPISPHCQQQQVLINDVGLHWKTSNPDTLTASQLMDYFRWSNASACQLTHDFGGKMKKNPSGLDGQKAVCLDVSVAPKAGKCLVYSFGINNEWSFDDAMSQYGCDSKANPWYTGPFKRLNISGSRGYEIAWYNSNLIPN